MTDTPNNPTTPPAHRAPRETAFDTLALHAGQTPDSDTGARATPIYQSAAFVFPDTDSAVGLFNIERAGHVYSRLSNPTNAVLEERMAALDSGVGAIATASGQAAMHLAVTTLLSAGDHIVASRSLYGGTHNLLEYSLPRFASASPPILSTPETLAPSSARFDPTPGCCLVKCWATQALKSWISPPSPMLRTGPVCRCW